MSDIAKLQYKGVAIRGSEDDFLNLTDMWRANGADPNKRPSDWIHKEGAPFIEFIEENNEGSKVPVIRIEDEGSTSAHWQIGWAYAGYLSHEFHLYCNSVVRTDTENKPTASAPEWLKRVVLSLPVNRRAQG